MILFSSSDYFLLSEPPPWNLIKLFALHLRRRKQNQANNEIALNEILKHYSHCFFAELNEFMRFHIRTNEGRPNT